ncbi:MAG: hypothetical protein ACJASM_003120 [Salibacteraceae bacterium]|jgi:hypothetical protein
MESNQMKGKTPLSSNSLAITMHRQNILLAHGGVCNHELRTEIIESVEQLLISLGERLQVKKRIINILVECLGNATLHADNKLAEKIYLCQP